MTTWTTACPDWEQRIVERRSLIAAPPLYPAEAERALEVFKGLRIVDVAGQPTFGEAAEQYVFDFVAAVFGAYDAETGVRMINEFFLLISKKNIKSTLSAGIMLTALILNWRHEAELLILAPTIEVAGNSFKPAAAMVRADEDLRKLLHVQDHIRTITHRTTGAALKVVAADSATVSGKKAAFVLIEELWIFGTRATSETMFQEATGGQVSRPEGFTIKITTQSDEPPAGVFKTTLDYARDVRDGKIDNPQFLPVIYEFPAAMVKSEAYLLPENFYITNPNMGRSVRRDWIEAKLKEKAGDMPSLKVFLAKHLNIEIGINYRANRWPGVDFWPKRTDGSISIASMLRRCEVMVAGIDGGGLDDLFGLSLVGRERDETEFEMLVNGVMTTVFVKRWLSWSHAWCHEGVLQNRQKIAAQLRTFEAADELTIVDDKLGDLSEIIAIVEQVKDAGLLAAIAVDPAGLGALADELEAIGVTQDAGTLIGVNQGYGLMNAIKTTERKLANGTFLHAKSRMMDWCVGNLKIEPTATAIRATKQTAGDAKIDPVMALFDAVLVMSKNPEAASDELPSDFDLMVIG